LDSDVSKLCRLTIFSVFEQCRPHHETMEQTRYPDKLNGSS
jgi:hypothetical protein